MTESNHLPPPHREALPSYPCFVRQLSQQEKEDLKGRICHDIGQKQEE